jgi:hypothetical protein
MFQSVDLNRGAVLVPRGRLKIPRRCFFATILGADSAIKPMPFHSWVSNRGRNHDFSRQPTDPALPLLRRQHETGPHRPETWRASGLACCRLFFLQ